MTEKQIQYRKMMLRQIHEHKEYKMRIEFDGWQEYLLNMYGVRSSADLSIAELINLLEIMDGKTKVVEIDDGKRFWAKKIKRKVDDGATDKQIMAIKSLWAGRSEVKTEMALRNFIERMFGYRPLHLNELKKSEASKIINALNNF